jgi:hypothetical protein
MYRNVRISINQNYILIKVTSKCTYFSFGEARGCSQYPFQESCSQKIEFVIVRASAVFSMPVLQFNTRRLYCLLGYESHILRRAFI